MEHVNVIDQQIMWSALTTQATVNENKFFIAKRNYSRAVTINKYRL